jgi:hypothetical protein
MIKMLFKVLFSSRGAFIGLMPATAVVDLIGYLPATRAVLATPEVYPPEDEQELMWARAGNHLAAPALTGKGRLTRPW